MIKLVQSGFAYRRYVKPISYPIISFSNSTDASPGETHKFSSNISHFRRKFELEQIMNIQNINSNEPIKSKVPDSTLYYLKQSKDEKLVQSYLSSGAIRLDVMDQKQFSLLLQSLHRTNQIDTAISLYSKALETPSLKHLTGRIPLVTLLTMLRYRDDLLSKGIELYLSLEAVERDSDSILAVCLLHLMKRNKKEITVLMDGTIISMKELLYSISEKFMKLGMPSSVAGLLIDIAAIQQDLSLSQKIYSSYNGLKSNRFSVFVESSMISHCLRAKDLKSAETILKNILASGEQLDHVATTRFINACQEVGDFASGIHIAQAYIQRGGSVDLILAGAIAKFIFAYEKKVNEQSLGYEANTNINLIVKPTEWLVSSDIDSTTLNKRFIKLRQDSITSLVSTMPRIFKSNEIRQIDGIIAQIARDVLLVGACDQFLRIILNAGAYITLEKFSRSYSISCCVLSQWKELLVLKERVLPFLSSDAQSKLLVRTITALYASNNVAHAEWIIQHDRLEVDSQTFEKNLIKELKNTIGCESERQERITQLLLQRNKKSQ